MIAMRVGGGWVGEEQTVTFETKVERKLVPQKIEQSLKLWQFSLHICTLLSNSHNSVPCKII